MSDITFTGLLLLLTVSAVAGLAVSCSAGITLSCDNSNIGLAPYVWKATGTGTNTRAEATMPGAYLRTIVNGTSAIGLVIDGTANMGCPAASMPYIEYSVDDGPFSVTQLSETDSTYTFSIVHDLDKTVPHKLEVYFRAADLFQQRWAASTAHLRIAGIAADDGAQLIPYPKRAKKAIGYGDSITEGVGVDSQFTSWQLLGPNNARCSWLPIVCAALDCEYGQLGTGGQGMTNEGMALPPLPRTWDYYDAATSRLQNGKLLPEPDYVFCCMGTNDYGDCNITDAYIGWIKAVRKACPKTRIFCIVPPSGFHRSDIQKTVKTCNAARDARVYIIDTPSLNSAIHTTAGSTKFTYDGVHPSLYGNAMFAACIVAEVQQIVSGERKP